MVESVGDYCGGLFRKLSLNGTPYCLLRSEENTCRYHKNGFLVLYQKKLPVPYRICCFGKNSSLEVLVDGSG